MDEKNGLSENMKRERWGMFVKLWIKYVFGPLTFSEFWN